jgi:RND family efflux transporter MFP subunit
VYYTEVRSPISGVVADRPIYAGDMANPGSPLVTVMDTSRVVARANVPQYLAASVKVGNTATITEAGSSFELPGKVTVVSPATDPSSTTVQVWVEAQNPGERLKPGAGVHVAIVTATIPNAVVVPPSALLSNDEGKQMVLVVQGNLAYEHTIETGAREADKVQIRSGVQPGDQVIVAGGVGLGDKAKVRVVTANDSGDSSSKSDKSDDAGQEKDNGK